MKKLILFLGFATCSYLLHAQNYYAVKIADSKTGDAIRNASVKIKSNNTTVNTNESGTVVITASSADSLQVSAKGYANREIKLAEQPPSILIYMVPQTNKQPGANKRKKHQERK